MGLMHPQSTDDSHAILNAFKGDQIQRLENDVKRLTLINEALQKRVTELEAKLEQTQTP